MVWEWKDITSYRRGDEERKPTSWQIGSKTVNVIITCGHIYYKGQWIMHCHIAGIDTHQLDAETLEDAKTEALKTAIERLEYNCKLLKAIASKTTGGE